LFISIIPMEKAPARYVFHAMVSGRDNTDDVPERMEKPEFRSQEHE
jgi:hypothetical protein